MEVGLDELNLISLAPSATTLNTRLDLLHRQNDKHLWDFGSVGKGVAGYWHCRRIIGQSGEMGLSSNRCALRSRAPQEVWNAVPPRALRAKSATAKAASDAQRETVLKFTSPDLVRPQEV
jgi:hypothetical protein